MASLTDQIGTAGSGRQIINPGPANPSFVGALADAARQVVPGLAQIGERREAARAGDALDQAAQIRHDTLNSFAQEATTPAPEYTQTGPVAIDGSLEGSGLPSDALAVADELRRAQGAVNQGRAPRASLDMRVEQSVNELFNKFPEQRAEIAQYMRSMGFEHYMYRAAEEEKLVSDADQAARLNADVAPAQYAQQRGLVTPEMSLPEQAAIGRAAQVRAAQEAALQARAEAALANRRLSVEERKAEQDSVANETISLVTNEINAAIDPVLRQSEALISLAGTDAERQQALSGTSTQVRAWLAGQRRTAIARITSVGGPNVSDNISAINSMFDNYEQSVQSLYTESFGANTRSMRNMQSWLSLNATQAAPMYSRMVSLLGSNQAVNALFASEDGTLPFPEEFRTALQNEFRNFDPTTQRGTLTMARLVGFMRGEVGYKDLQANEAAAYITGNSRVLRANLDQVVAGNTAAVRPWSVNYANAAEAAVELAPTTAAPSSINRAAGQLAGPGNIQALDALVAQDPEYGQSVAQASRAGATNLMLIARQQLTRLTEAGPYTLQYNANPRSGTAGNFELRLTREEYDRWAARQSPSTEGATGEFPSGVNYTRTYEDMQRQLPEELSQLLSAANASLAHLANTTKFTDELPTGLTSRQIRTYYATGALPAGITRPAEAAGPSGDTAFNNQVAEFESSLKADIGQNLEQPLPEFRRRLAQSESGGDITELNDEGYGGRMQFGTERLVDAAQAGLVPPGTTGAAFSRMSEEQQRAVEDWHFADIDRRAEAEGLTRRYGETIAGVPINANSVRAMAHLGGLDGAKRFIETNGRYNPSDSNGTSLSDYGRRFGS